MSIKKKFSDNHFTITKYLDLYRFHYPNIKLSKDVSDFLAVNPDKSVQKIKKEVDAAVKAVRRGGDINKIKTVKLQLDKIVGLGGMNKVVPSEGIVFKYKGGSYKFTGAFAPVNQIAGLLKFGGR